MELIRLLFMLFVLFIVPALANGTSASNTSSGGPGYGVGYSVQQTSDGGYIIAGSMYSYNAAHLSQMVWLIKTDADGNKVLDRIFDGPLDDWGNSVQQTSDGGYIITGSTYSYGEGAKNSALWLIKADRNGNKVWDRMFS